MYIAINLLNFSLIQMIFYSSFKLFFLRKLLWSAFDFPRWQSVLAITLFGVLDGLYPIFSADTIERLNMPLIVFIPFMVFLAWFGFLVFFFVLHWWIKRGQRWDGHGDLFNLMTASWIVGEIIGSLLKIPSSLLIATYAIWVTLPYNMWVMSNALSGAIPKVSFGYAISGCIIGFISASIASGIVLIIFKN